MKNRLKSAHFNLDPVSRSLLITGSLLGRLWRTSISDPCHIDLYNDRGAGNIYCFWHAHLLSIAFTFRQTGKTALISESRDGRRAAAIAQRWQHEVILGSSSHGGAKALRDCVRSLKQGNNLAITPDGPRGPRQQVKPGVAQIALLSGSPVIPLKASAESAWYLSSWDHFAVPKPFTRLQISVGTPIDPKKYLTLDNPLQSLTAAIQEGLTK